MVEAHIPPAFEKTDFHCPRCGVYAHQTWLMVRVGQAGPGFVDVEETMTCVCQHCQRRSWWVNTRLVEPIAALGPLPHVDIPEDVKEDYEEARSIAAQSPRGACALLRLGLQKLCESLGQPGKNINEDIGNLVKERGLLPQIQQSLDALRVIGNNAVHPGSLDLRDDQDTVIALLNTMNVIVEQLIAAPKHAAELYAKVPQPQQEAITRREETP
jgi:Domain of unknown function (DUF4145)